MPATMKEVALRAGVSIRTVSRAINGLGDISVETRQKVLAVAEQTGYRPSMLARALVTHRSRTLGLVIPHLTNPYFAEVAQGVFDTARQSGYRVLMNHCNWHTEPELESWQALADHSVDGMITDLLYGHEPQIIQYARTHKPVVVLMKQIALPGISTVGVDIEKAAQMAVEYLVKKGHRQIAMLSVRLPNPEHEERTTAYRRVMADCGLPEIIQLLDPGWKEPDVQNGYRAGLQLFAHHPRVTAVFAYNDLLAIGALQACKETGRGVPDDCAVVGFDDIPFASLISPALTTVRVDKYALGSFAVLRLLEMLNRPEQVFESKMMEAELVVRESA